MQTLDSYSNNLSREFMGNRMVEYANLFLSWDEPFSYWYDELFASNLFYDV